MKYITNLFKPQFESELIKHAFSQRIIDVSFSGNIGISRVFNIKGMEHVPNIFMSFDKYLFLEVINILIYIGHLNNVKYNCSKNIWILS